MKKIPLSKGSMALNRDKKREKNLINLMKTVGKLCDIVCVEKELLRKSGYSEEELNEIECYAGQAF